MLQYFDVALWLRWPSPMPEYVGCVQAPTAFAAVECLMRFSDLFSVAYASARVLDGSLIYRAYRVRLEVEDEECSQVA